MANINNCDIPEDLWYDVGKGVWARFDDGIITVGMTDPSQSLAGTVRFARVKKLGRKMRKGQSMATIESAKWVGPLPCPVDGEIYEINEEIRDRPSYINLKRYEAWILKVKADDPDDRGEMLTGAQAVEAYSKKLQDENINCKHITPEEEEERRRKFGELE